MGIFSGFKKMWQKPKNRVEIIPWNHNLERKRHAEVIAYIQRLPKNSTLGIEMSPRDVYFTSKALGIVSGEQLRETMTPLESKMLQKMRAQGQTPEIPFAGNRDLWTGMEVLHECRKRNIRVEPMTNTLSIANVVKAKDGYQDMEADAFTDETLFRNTCALLPRHEAKTIYVLVGTAHAIELWHKLRDRGIASHINTALFSNPKKIEKHMRAYVQYYNAGASGNVDAALKIKNWLVIANTEPENQRAAHRDEIYRRLLQDFRKRHEEQVKRVLRRKAGKKTRHGKR